MSERHAGVLFHKVRYALKAKLARMRGRVVFYRVREKYRLYIEGPRDQWAELASSFMEACQTLDEKHGA